jgi:hypothetical protein
MLTIAEYLVAFVGAVFALYALTILALTGLAAVIRRWAGDR